MERRLSRACAATFEHHVPDPAVRGRDLCQSRWVLFRAHELDVAASQPVEEIVMRVVASRAADAEGRIVAPRFILVDLGLENRNSAGTMAGHAEDLRLG